MNIGIGGWILILELTFKVEKNELEIPISYNHILQAFIYNNISKELADFLHNEGYIYNNRIFKLFVFSKIRGKFKLDRKNHSIKFMDSINIRINSPLDVFCKELANSIIVSNYLELIGNKISLESVNFQAIKINKEDIILKTLSPIVMYSTVEKPNGKKFTYYFQPGDPNYDKMISENLKKKYKALYKKEPKNEDIRIKQLTTGKMRKLSYKKFAIRGWDGKLKIEGPKELLKLGVETG